MPTSYIYFLLRHISGDTYRHNKNISHLFINEERGDQIADRDDEIIVIPPETGLVEAVPAHTLDIMLAGYEEAGTRYLKEARYLGEGRIAGDFEIRKHFYYGSGDRLYHLTEVEATLIFNQLAYVDFAHMLATGRIPDLGVIPPEQFLRFQTTGTWIKESRFEYFKPIDLNLKHGKFKAESAIKSITSRMREKDRSIKVIVDISIEGSSVIASRDTRLIIPF